MWKHSAENNWKKKGQNTALCCWSLDQQVLEITVHGTQTETFTVHTKKTAKTKGRLMNEAIMGDGEQRQEAEELKCCLMTHVGV